MYQICIYIIALHCNFHHLITTQHSHISISHTLIYFIFFIFILIQISSSKQIDFDVFLSHDWGVDHANHNRVSAINKELKRLGLRTWFDDEKMHSNILNLLTDAIDRSSVFVAFITDNYMEKVAKPTDYNYCKMEFNYAVTRRKRILAVVMDPSVKDTATWYGPVAAIAAGSLYVNMSRNDDVKSMLAQLEHFGIVTKDKVPVSLAIL